MNRSFVDSEKPQELSMSLLFKFVHSQSSSWNISTTRSQLPRNRKKLQDGELDYRRIGLPAAAVE
jgi:hypothetical protein